MIMPVAKLYCLVILLFFICVTTSCTELHDTLLSPTLEHLNGYYSVVFITADNLGVCLSNKILAILFFQFVTLVCIQDRFSDKSS